MQSDPPHKAPSGHHKPAPSPRKRSPAQRLAHFAKDRRTRLLLIVAGAAAGVAVLALVVVNLLISADWVRDRVAARIKEQTGRELEVNGTTALLFTPGPKVIISDATITDPEQKAGTSDLHVGRLVLNLSFMELMSRQVDAERVVLESPVLTLRLGEEEKVEQPKQRKAEAAGPPRDKPRREVKLRDVRIEDGTIDIVYDENGKERRIEHISANLSLPSSADPFAGTGKFDWKEQTVDFSFGLTSLADLREKRPAKLELSLDTPAIAARFTGSVLTRPKFSGEGELSAKAHSIPSLLAWMREKPAVSSAIGDGELASHVEWKNDEITFSAARFALEHASGQGQAVLTLKSPRPHVRAALALDHLDLNPFLANGAASPGAKAKPAEQSAPDKARSAEAPKDWFAKPDSDQTGSAAGPQSQPPPQAQAETQGSAPVAPAPAPAAEPASFDADVNLNIRQTRVAHLDLGPASLGLAFRDGVLNATLGGLELYDGHASGKLTLDASKPVPDFSGDFRLEGVQAKTLLSDAAQFSLLEGQTKLALQISGAGSNSEEIKSSLQGRGSLAVSDGAIDGVNLTEMIRQIGEGQVPDMRQGPGNKTAFSDLGGSFTIANGVAQTNNLQMTSPLLKVTTSGSVDLAQSTIDMQANPEIVAGPEGQGGANDLAGLSVPVRIEGPLDKPVIRPEIKAMFANPEKAGKTVNQIGKALEKKFKGKPVGEAIGRFLGNVQIGPRDDNGGAAPQANRQGSGKNEKPKAKPDAGAGEEESDSGTTGDPDLDNILR